MKTKDLNLDATKVAINNLKARIAFNNELNKFVRKYRKDHADEVKNFNGYWDAPTKGMLSALVDIIDNAKFGDMSWLTPALKIDYVRSCGAIFGLVYSPAVNTYVLNDLHDCEKHLAMLEKASANTTQETDAFKIERDLANNRLNLTFDGKPDDATRSALKHYGFKWSPYLGCWTRQLTDNAEHSLNRLIRELAIAG